MTCYSIHMIHPNQTKAKQAKANYSMLLRGERGMCKEYYGGNELSVIELLSVDWMFGI